MKHLLGIATLIFSALCNPAPAQESDSVDWLDNLQQATEVAQRTGLPMFVVFR
ncbi:MAG: hypothetical protein HQ519_07400 [Planctomycetes bacterium]|nr:hypothetical protein [Planctomycetota bacterium]